MGSSGILCVCGWRGTCICVCVCVCVCARTCAHTCTVLAVHVNEMKKFSEFSINILALILVCSAARLLSFSLSLSLFYIVLLTSEIYQCYISILYICSHWFLYYVVESPGTGVLCIGMTKVKTVEMFGPFSLFLSDVRL
jgi:hypothetical protein